jgi:rod shape-determining protein MreC
MLEFVRRNRIVLTSGFLLLLSLLLVSASARAARPRDPLTIILLEGMRPLQLLLSEGQRGLADAWNHYLNLVGVRTENEALKRRIRLLEHEVRQVAPLRESNQRLSALLGLRASLDGHAQAARISGRDPVALFQSVTIDKGEQDGIAKGFAVVADDGLIGRVVATSAHAARVLLITDHNSGVDAVVERSRARGIVAGALSDGCVMKYLQRGEDVTVGDRVATSGLDGIFPKGIPIGEVTKVSRNHRGMLQVAEIRPSAELERLDEVLVVAPSARVLDYTPASAGS